MALDASSLATALQAVFDASPATPADAADAFASAYNTYAGAGRFGTNVPALTGRKAALAATLATSLALPGLPGTFAAAWASGVNAFWTAVAVASPLPQAGTTAGCPGASTLTGSLSTLFANLTNTSATCAAGMATALDTATKSVIATVAPPPSTTFNCA